MRGLKIKMVNTVDLLYADVLGTGYTEMCRSAELMQLSKA
jgi:hypothetical protein